MGVLELRTINIKELVPPIDVSAHISQLMAAPILSQTLRAGVLKDFSFAGVVSMQTPPHSEAIAFFAFASGQLGASEVEFLRQPVDKHLLQFLR
jgi:hypothetical protein